MLRHILPVHHTCPSIKVMSNIVGNSRLSFACSQQVYKPLLPLTQNYNTLYIYPVYSQGETLRPHPISIYMIPSALLALNNCLTQWTLYNSVGLAALVLGSLFLRFNIRNTLSILIHCIQTDPQLRYIYLTLPASGYNFVLNAAHEVHYPEKEQLQKNYHPLKQKYPNLKITSDLMDFLLENARVSEKEDGSKLHRKFNQIENRLVRFKIPSQMIKFKIMINPQEQAQFLRDKDRLTQKEMIKKYEKENVEVQVILSQGITPLNKGKVIKYRLQAPQNQNKRYHDYVLALALGYRIDTSDNKKEQDIRFDEHGRIHENATTFKKVGDEELTQRRKPFEQFGRQEEERKDK